MNMCTHIVTALLAAILIWSPTVQADPVNYQDNPWFEIGEKLDYHIYWGIFHVALSEATTQWVEHEGKQMISIQFRTRSNSFIENFYPVDDFLESLIDPETFLPVRFIKRLREGSYRCDEVTTFDHEAGTAEFVKTHEDGRVTTRTYEIKPDTRDLICTMYYLRSKPLEVGKDYTLEVMADEKLYDLFLNVPKKETVDLPAYGELPTIRIEPKAKFEGLFVRKGKMTVWATDGPYRVLAKVSAKVPVAKVHIKLYNVGGPDADTWRERAVREEKESKTRRRGRRRR